MTGHIFIYGEIGRGTGQVSVNTVRAQIDPKASDYILHIASPGGDVFEGFGIYNVLKNAGKPIETHIESVTASIATLVSFAGERIVMNRTAQFMIHNPFISEQKGDASELRKVAAQLDKIKTLLMDVTSRRAARNGKAISTDELSKLYDNETWLNSDEALKMGFVDDVQDALRAVARIDLNQIRKMEKENWLQSVVKNLFSTKKFKNEFTETLQDGTVVIVMSEDGDWTGKQVVAQTGEPLAPGDYTLASGKVISVGENSTISEVKDAPAAQNTEDDMSKLKELEEKLAASEQARAAAEAQLAQATQVADTATQATAKFENSIKAMQAQLAKIQEDQNKVVGQAPPLNRGPVLAQAGGVENYDPMGEDALSFYKSQNRIKNG
jgi:ATP-dependent protease ClpP protease subunit